MKLLGSAQGLPSNLAKRKRIDFAFKILCAGAALVGVIILILLLYRIFADGIGRLSIGFLRGDISQRPLKAGIWPAIVGTGYVMLLTGVIAVPVGVAAAIYLEEFTPQKNKFTEFIQLNIANLAGVPSIVYGLLGLAVFVRYAGMGTSMLAGALTMALLILPMIIIVTQESLRAVPSSFREASLGLGSTLWQAIRYQVLPSALPGIFTGIILALSRAIGETAPLVVVGAVVGIVSTPTSLRDRYTALPLQIFNWAQDPRAEAHRVSAAAIVVLMIGLLFLNSIAIVLRNRAKQRRS